MENRKEMMHALLKSRGTNQLDALTDGLVNAMKYSNAEVLYPEFDDVEPGQGVNPEWFYAVYKSANDFSEMNAIMQYVSQESMYEDIGELMLGIALVEMKHYDKLGDFIGELGGNIRQTYDTSAVAYGKTAREAVMLGIKAEDSTIREYERIGVLVKAAPESTTKTVALQLLAKLIADEQWHTALFEEWLQKNPDVK